MEKAHLRHLLELSPEEKRTFLDSFDMIMSDCDGVVWNFTGPIPGVDRALQLLKEKGKKLAFISNNGMRTMAEYKHKFQQLGVDPPEHDIVHPALTTVKYLKSINMRNAVYCIGTEVFKDYLRNAGFEVLDGPTDHIADERIPNGVRVFSEYFSKTTGPKVGAVVVDIDVNISLSHMMKAKCYLQQNRDCLLIAGATDYIIPLDSSMDVIGPGYFIEILERASNRKAMVLGKPGQALAEFILEQFHVTQPERTLFIGDMLPQDMGFGTRCGFQKVLMLSGGTTKEMLMTHEKPHELPHFYADSFADFVQLYKDVSN
ncbi:uncharacterized protein LOC131435096 isoform X2 [Malaya genurostris]|nr:uncharacterized protein LOC131435096 isoform X2 [Malaya genurostris]XP_058458594.1 uncharacterized protein LOC131435096 isoform X2 [Malaya genurostris]